MSEWNLCPQCGLPLGNNAPLGVDRCAGHATREQDTTRRLAFAIYQARATREKYPVIAQSFEQLTQEAQRGYLQEAQVVSQQMGQST